ncbi:MAG: NirA family protein [Verrucomicrobiae bacterium]|nr:NirA family protein [Verrucomicrobiae bacterium]
MPSPPLLESVNGAPLNAEQRQYLEGFFSGLASRGVTFGDVAPAPVREEAAPLIFEERVKKEEHPLDSYHLIAENALGNKAPDKEETFRFKWHGLFYLSPVRDAFMARLRIPGGQLKSFQLREIARVARELTTGYIQITTRANFQIRLIQPKDAPEFLRRIQSVGLHTRGAGADNIRNITANPTAGVDRYERVDVTPFVQELSQQIISHRDYYDLPRKFNIALDGGGLIGAVEDTNDIGASAVEVAENGRGVPAGVYFRIKLGGATGHKAFARDMGVLVAPEQLVKVVLALVRVYIKNGCRTDRKKARLKHLLDSWSLAHYLAETEKLLGFALIRDPLDEQGASAITTPSQAPETPHSHMGVFPQKQRGLNYVGIGFNIGQVTPEQLLRLADLADHYGSGELRLTVWQNLILPNIPDAYVETVRRNLQRLGMSVRPSNVSSGVISCTGNRYCKFSASDTKGHASDLVRHLEKRVTLDRPVNIHFTGCAHSCAQHYMGDIGLLGTKITLDGGTAEGYHVFVGGGFGDNRAIGRQVFQGLPHGEVNQTIERMLRAYVKHRRDSGETFQQFAARHEVNVLQVLFSGEDA